MGERGARLEDATEEDSAAMRTLAADAMRAGAIGFSSSCTLNHRTSTGDPTPSLRARSGELEAIALGVADAGHGVIEIISDFWPDTDGEFELIRNMVVKSGRPLSLSLAQSHRQPDVRRDLLRRIEESVAEGLPIRAQVAPLPGRPAGRPAVVVPPVPLMFPAYGDIVGRPVDEQARALRLPVVPGACLLAEQPGDERRKWPPQRATPSHRLRPAVPAGRRPGL